MSISFRKIFNFDRLPSGETTAKVNAGPSSATSSKTEKSSGDYVACILVDHGKSLKLGIIRQ
jgi:hypothetical protein